MEMYSQHVSSLSQLSAWLEELGHLASKSILIQIYSGLQPKELEAYLRRLRVEFSQAHIIGASAKLVFANADARYASTVVNISCFEHTRITQHCLPVKSDKTVIGQQLLSDAVESDTRVLLCLADGISAADPEAFAALNQTQPLIPVAGGVAQPLQHGRGAWVLSQDQFHQDTVVAVALNSAELRVWRDVHVEWFPIGKRMRIEQVEGRRVYQLEGKTPHQLYCDYLGDGQFLPFSSIQDFPLMTCDDVAAIVSPEHLHQDGSIQFIEDFEKGQQVQFCYSHPSLTQERIEHGCQQLRQEQPQAIWVFNCAARAVLADDKHAQELEPFAAIAPTSGFFCNGEFVGMQQQRIVHHSLTYLAMSESTAAPQQATVREPIHGADNPLTPLFRLIRNSLSDLNLLNQDLESQVADKTQALVNSYTQDRLTSLPNNLALTERLSQQRDVEHLVILKLSNFSNINQHFGHATGDFVLVAVSELLRVFCRVQLSGHAEPYRVGTSVWGIAVNDQLSQAQVESAIVRFIERVERKGFSMGEQNTVGMLHVSLTSGMAARSDLSGLRPIAEEFVLKAYEARRAAKLRKRPLCMASQITPEQREVGERMTALKRVHGALKEDQVKIFGHPIYHAGSRELFSTECLVRIVEQQQVIMPGSFLPAIQDTHLYSKLSRQVITKSFELMDPRKQRYSINLASQDLDNDETMKLLLDGVAELRHPDMAGFEIVETEQISDYGRLREVAAELRHYGASLYIDDFGSGYSNLDEVLQLEPQVIKLDGSLIKNIDTNKRQRMLVAHLNQLCHSLEIKTVAEFVHSDRVCQILEELGVDYLQGFFLAKPQAL